MTLKHFHILFGLILFGLYVWLFGSWVMTGHASFRGNIVDSPLIRLMGICFGVLFAYIYYRGTK